MSFVSGGGLGAVVNVAELESLAKGTIVVGDGNGAPTTLAVGSNGFPLVARSTTASGLSFETLGIAAGGTGATTSAGAREALGVPSKADNLSVFGSTTSAQLAGVMTDETGTGSLVFGTAPTFTTSLQIGTASLNTGSLKLAHASSAFVTTISSGNAAAAVTYVWPTNVGGAGTYLTDAAGNGTLSWATPAGFSYGASISGTTDAGCTITLSNSSADGAAALKLVAGNTQASQPVLANLQIGTSTNVMGLLIQGAGGSAGGAAGTGKTHLCLWGNTADDMKVLLIGTGTSFTESISVSSVAGIAVATGAGGYSGIASNLPANANGSIAFSAAMISETQATPSTFFRGSLGTSGKIMGLCIYGTGSLTGGTVGTGTNHVTLWGNTANNANKLFSCGNGVSFTETAFLTGVGSLSLGAAAINDGTQVLQVKTGTAPTAATADTVVLYSSDDAAGHTIPSFFCEGTNVIATAQADSVSSVRVKMRINGTVVTLLAI